MRVVHIVASIDDEAAGPSVSVTRLAEAQTRAGAVAELATVAGWKPGSARAARIPHMRHPASFSRVPVLRGLAASHAMRKALLDRACSADVFHSHGLWLMPNVYPAEAARAGGGAFVISPRGMLAAAARQFSAGKKRIFWALAQRRAAETAALFHATSEQEAQDIRAAGLATPIVVAANGMPPHIQMASLSTAGMYNLLNLFFGLGGLVTPLIAARLFQNNSARLLLFASSLAGATLVIHAITSMPGPSGQVAFQVSAVGGLLTKVIGRVPIVGSSGTIAGLELTAERMAGRRHRVASVIVHRVAQEETAPQSETEGAHGHSAGR